MLGVLSILSLSLSLSLSSSSLHDRRHRPLCKNISYEWSDMIPGRFIKVLRYFRFFLRTHGRTDGGTLRGPRGPKNRRLLDAKNLHCLDHMCTYVYICVHSANKREGASSSEFWSGRPNGAIWWQLKAVFSLSSTSLWPAAGFFFTTS